MLRFVVAMPAEAKPLIDYFRLTFVDKRYGFSLYQHDDISLVTSGLGKVNAAAAALYLQTRIGERESAIWVNLGVAGHVDLPIGMPILASAVQDQATGRVWRMPVPDAPGCQCHELMTLDQPDFDYRFREVIEMEASGFVPTVRRFVRPESVHCFKVIADNSIESGDKFDPAAASVLIADAMPALDDVLSALLKQSIISEAGG